MIHDLRGRTPEEFLKLSNEPHKRISWLMGILLIMIPPIVLRPYDPLSIIPQLPLLYIFISSSIGLNILFFVFKTYKYIQSFGYG